MQNVESMPRQIPPPLSDLPVLFLARSPLLPKWASGRTLVDPDSLDDAMAKAQKLRDSEWGD